MEATYSIPGEDNGEPGMIGDSPTEEFPLKQYIDRKVDLHGRNITDHPWYG